MITDINRKSVTSSLNKSKLPAYWNQYFDYEKDSALYDLTKNVFLDVIESEKKNQKPFIDSQIVISRILTDFGLKSKFHRQFNENHPNLKKEQVLGMQLYKIMLDDKDVWIYIETQHSNHLFPHATYFK